MQIIKTIEQSTRTDTMYSMLMVGVVIVFILGLIAVIATVDQIQSDKKARLMMVIGIVTIIASMIGLVTFGSAQKNLTPVLHYEAVISDKSSLEKQNYVIVEHVTDDVYIIKKDN